MSNGICCKYCGYQETDHEFPERFRQRNRKRKGYKVPLTKCGGFVGEEEPPGLTDFEAEALEIRARARTAWGGYAAMCRQIDFEKKLSNIKGESKKMEFIEKCKKGNSGFYVG